MSEYMWTLSFAAYDTEHPSKALTLRSKPLWL